MALCRIHGTIDEKMYVKVKKMLDNVQGGANLVLHISSVGGEIAWANKIYQMLISAQVRSIATYAIGYEKVHSAALIVFLGCTYRDAYKETRFLIHKATPVAHSLRDEHSIAERECFSAITQITTLTTEELTRFSEGNTYLDYDQAVKYKIINFSIEKTMLRNLHSS